MADPAPLPFDRSAVLSDHRMFDIEQDDGIVQAKLDGHATWQLAPADARQIASLLLDAAEAAEGGA